jgi:alkanesulfonate monooxygenase SsuD/methylene tetrahydromethanopterin reductase-like flavin-dependent oxidoreductase (luciferase family)
MFHSIGRIDSLAPRPTDREVYESFFAQVDAAERLGYGTVWVAESHFSSEVQKGNSDPVIPHYQGEVGLNADSFQLANLIFERTERIGFGTAILNIVGGNGGPIAAADRVRSLAWLNTLRKTPRRLDIGVATGRFPYINQPFGIVPRGPVERRLWPEYQRLIFIEALEIFLRLGRGETFGSAQVTPQRLTRALFRDDAAFQSAQAALAGEGVRLCPVDGLAYEPRWRFEPLKLVPDLTPAETPFLRFVLGSSDPLARDHGMKYADLDLFNLSFTPPAAIDKIHGEQAERCSRLGRQWHRGRMPRTVLIFIDKDPAVAAERASRCFDTYIEAMRGTAAVPAKVMLMERALIGDPAMIRAQLGPNDSHGFHPGDRLMLWFEFNQSDGAAVLRQMELFARDVMPHVAT